MQFFSVEKFSDAYASTAMFACIVGHNCQVLVMLHAINRTIEKCQSMHSCVFFTCDAMLYTVCA